MKEGGGGDHISVGVKLPSGVLQRPVSNKDVYIKPPGIALQSVFLPSITCSRSLPYFSKILCIVTYNLYVTKGFKTTLFFIHRSYWHNTFDSRFV